MSNGQERRRGILCARRGNPEEHSDGRVPSRSWTTGNSQPIRSGLSSGATATSIRSSSGAARTSRTGVDLVVQAPPLYIQEKVHPKVLIDDLLRRPKARTGRTIAEQLGSFRRLQRRAREVAKTEFYQHDQNWSNRMILGDSLQVMASLGRARRAARQGAVHLLRPALRHQVQLQLPVVHDQPRREGRQCGPHHPRARQVKAFRDTWRDGIHSYLTYLRDRLTVGRDCLTESGSIFVQIGDENVHRVRALMDEVFGEDNFVSANCFHHDNRLFPATNSRSNISIPFLVRESRETNSN